MTNRTYAKYTIARPMAQNICARHLGTPGHGTVNGLRVNIPRYRLQVGEVSEVTDASKQLALVIEAPGLAERDVPDYIEVDHSKMPAKLPRIPQLPEVPCPPQM